MPYLNLLELTGNGASQTAQDTTVALLCARLWKYGNFGASDRPWHHQSWGVESINCEFAEPAD